MLRPRLPTSIVAAAVIVAGGLVAAPALARDDHGAHRGRGGEARHHDRHGGRHQDRRHDSRRHHDRDGGGVSIRFHFGDSSHGGHSRYHRPQVHRRYVPGYYEKRWVPAVYETHYDDCGRAYRVLVRDGCYEKVWVPGRYVETYVRPGHHGVRRYGHSRHHGSHSGVRVSGHYRF